MKIWKGTEVIEGIETFDDAGVYRLDGKTALVQTVDFFTPIVDDPYAYGQIAAANSLSDIYAMGGRPITALNILCVPTGEISMEDIHRILQGGADKLKEAACSLLGGHTVIDKELKFGCAVTGLIEPENVWSNAGARAGSRLVLTKPVGTGILTSALKQGKLSPEATDEVTRVMATLNRDACEAARRVGGVRAATDITGFGLAGHAALIAKASGVTIRIEAAQVPMFAQAVELARQGVKNRSQKLNREFLRGHYQTAPSIDRAVEDVIFDAQTSGGLLLAVEPNRVEALMRELQSARTPAASVVGEVLPREGELYLKIS